MGSKSRQAFKDKATADKTRARIAARREKFLAQYNANPCNFLPGFVLRSLYSRDVKQRTLEVLAANWIKAFNESWAHDTSRGTPHINWPVQS